MYRVPGFQKKLFSTYSSVPNRNACTKNFPTCTFISSNTSIWHTRVLQNWFESIVINGISLESIKETIPWNAVAGKIHCIFLDATLLIMSLISCYYCYSKQTLKSFLSFFVSFLVIYVNSKSKKLDNIDIAIVNLV